MTDTFIWVPSIGYAEDIKPRVTLINFGDGYSQRVSSSINNVANTWNLQFINQTTAQAAIITTFLESKGGHEYFFFTPEGATTPIKVTCSEWSEEYIAHFSRTVKAVFKRVNDKTV